MDNNLNELMQSTMQKVRELVDVNTIIGAPIRTDDGITLIPVSKVSFGFAGGGSDITAKNQPSNSAPFGGGSGAGVNIAPVAFLVIKDGSVRLLNIQPPASNTVDRVIDLAPDIVDKGTTMIGKKDVPKDTAE